MKFASVFACKSRGCELDRFLTEFKFEFEFKRYLQLRVRVLRILFSSLVKMTEFFEFAALDFIGRNGMNN